jgi:hypothetical protein
MRPATQIPEAMVKEKNLLTGDVSPMGESKYDLDFKMNQSEMDKTDFQNKTLNESQYIGDHKSNYSGKTYGGKSTTTNAANMGN